MSTVELQRVKEKVEAGECLSDSELEWLKKAAFDSAGVLLKRTAAQALIDAQKPWEALAILEPLRRQFPGDVRVRLILGRAFESLGRSPEAERAYHEALALESQALEALRGLLQMSIRRGEWAQAREWLEAALRVDPDDAKTRELKRTLETREREPAFAPVDEDTYVDALLSRLRQQSTPHLLQKDAVLVRLGKGNVARLELKALHEAFVEEKVPLPLSVELLSRDLAEKSLGEVEDGRALLSRVLPVLREATFLDRALGAACREGPGELCVFYVMDDAELTRLLPMAVLREQRLSIEEVDRAAWRNLEARPGTLRSVMLQDGHLVLSPKVTGLWALAEGDGHDSARLLTQAQRHTFSDLGPAPYRVFLGMRELVVLCQQSRPEWVQKMEALEPSVDGIAGVFTLDEKGRLKRLAETREVGPLKSESA